MSEGIKAAAKPPKGFTSTPNSKVGSYRKRMANGGYVYWTPGKDGKGRFSTEKEKQDTSTFKDIVLAALDEILPPEKKNLRVKFADLLDKEETSEKSTKPKAESVPDGGVESPDSAQEEKHPEPKKNTKLREELDKEKAELKHKVDELEMGRDLKNVKAASGAVAKLITSEKDDQNIKQAEEAVMKRWGKDSDAESTKKGLFQALVDELLKARASKREG